MNRPCFERRINQCVVSVLKSNTYVPFVWLFVSPQTDVLINYCAVTRTSNRTENALYSCNYDRYHKAGSSDDHSHTRYFQINVNFLKFCQRNSLMAYDCLVLIFPVTLGAQHSGYAMTTKLQRSAFLFLIARKA